MKKLFRLLLLFLLRNRYGWFLVIFFFRNSFCDQAPGAGIALRVLVDIWGSVQRAARPANRIRSNFTFASTSGIAGNWSTTGRMRVGSERRGMERFRLPVKPLHERTHAAHLSKAKQSHQSACDNMRYNSRKVILTDDNEMKYVQQVSLLFSMLFFCYCLDRFLFMMQSLRFLP